MEGPQGRFQYPVSTGGDVSGSYDYEQEAGMVEGLDPRAVYERLDLTVLSRVGERLDRVGRHTPWG